MVQMSTHTASVGVSARMLLVIMYTFFRLAQVGVLRLELNVLNLLGSFTSSVEAQMKHFESITCSASRVFSEKGTKNIPMRLENLAQFVDSLRLVDIEIKNVLQRIAQRVGRVCLHMTNEVDQFCGRYQNFLNNIQHQSYLEVNTDTLKNHSHIRPVSHGKHRQAAVPNPNRVQVRAAATGCVQTLDQD